MATPPTIQNFFPLAGSIIYSATSIIFDITDDSGQFSSIAVLVKFPQSSIYEVAHDGTSFGYAYSSSSYRIPIFGGFTYSLTRNSGWPLVNGVTSQVVLVPIAVDTSGSVNQ